MIDTIDLKNKVYYAIMDKLPKKRKTVYQLIEHNQPCTAKEISDKYYIPINEVHPRITELRKSGYITTAGTKKSNRTKHQNTLYRLASEEERDQYIKSTLTDMKSEIDKLTEDYILNELSSYGKKELRKRINKLEWQYKKLQNEE
tara:strand:+ start:3188 stop:3622 length:435 start_codon:yes stop_codon:yes gene_type:complete